MASNPYVLERLAGIQKQLIAAHEAGGGMSSASKGNEREDVVNKYLREVMPAPFRFGNGDITDRAGARTGQLDVVLENPFLPSLPVVGGGETRLYLAEGVAAVIEVKSDLAGQWSEVEATSKKVRPLTRDFGSTMVFGSEPPPHIPLFAIGFKGWKTLETLQEHVQSGVVDGALVLEGGFYWGTDSMYATGPWALWALIDDVHHSATRVKAIGTRVLAYAL